MAQPKQSGSRWLQYPQMEMSKFAAPEFLQDDYVIIASSSHDEGLYSYHLSKNKWYLIWKYPLGVEPLRHSILVDERASKIYLYNTIPSACDCFFEIDINTKAHTSYRGTVHGLPEGLGNESGGCALLSHIDGSLHAIGGYTNCYHSVWHPSDDTVHMFKQYPISNRSSKTSLYGHALIKIESKNQLVMLGGNSSMMFGGYVKDIWICNVKHMQWHKLDDVTMPHKMCYFGYIVTNNERYGEKAITFGGKTSSGLINEIWILDLNDWTWTKSDIKCPKKAMYYAVSNSIYDIHLFEINKNSHWKMKLSDIMRMPKKSKSEKKRQSQIDLNIITSLKACLIQEKKKARILSQQNHQYSCENVENEEKLNDAKNENIILFNENEKLNDRLKTLEIAYDELNKNVIKKDKEFAKINEDYKELNEKYDVLLEKEKRKTLNNTSNYRNWSYHDIVYWISYLDAGKFEKYEQVLKENMKKENIKGYHLIDLDKHDIHRLGCIDYEDKKSLLAHFQSLRN